jgi:hypothetical protein
MSPPPELLNVHSPCVLVSAWRRVWVKCKYRYAQRLPVISWIFGDFVETNVIHVFSSYSESEGTIVGCGFCVGDDEISSFGKLHH